MKDEITDTERLDFLQRKLGTYTGMVVCRWSVSGRGWRLHETGGNDGVPNVRTAIDKFMEDYGD